MDGSAEKFKLTAREVANWKFSRRFLKSILRRSQERGLTPSDAEVDLSFVPRLEDTVGQVTGLYRDHTIRSYYLTEIVPREVGDSYWDVLRHEAGHVYLGHAERGITTSQLEERGDYLSMVIRDLEASVASSKLIGTLPGTPGDLVDQVLALHQNGFELDQAWGIVQQAARKLSIPFKYIKRARKPLGELGYSW